MLARPALAFVLALSLVWGAGTPQTQSIDLPLAPTPGVTAWQKGFAFYDRPEAYGAPQTLESLRRLKATGANYVAPVVTWHVDGKHGSSVRRSAETPTDAHLAALVQRAHAIGLNVLLMLHVDSTDQTWRGFLAPQDVGAWFASYEEMVLHYAGFAAAQGVEGMVIGKELVSLSGPAHTAHWVGLICRVRGHYDGVLTYSANWGGGVAQLREDPLEEFSKIQFWDYLDYLGLSAYFELTRSYEPTLAELKTGWEAWNRSRIAPFQTQHGLPLLFTEVGYRSVAGAAMHPWDQYMQGGPSMQAQADLYRAFFEYWSAVPWVAGVHIWDWKGSAAAGGPADVSYTPQNKLAEKVISAWYSARQQWVSDRSGPVVRSVQARSPHRCGVPLLVRQGRRG